MELTLRQCEQEASSVSSGRHAAGCERAAVTPEMAARLDKMCGNGAGLWLRM